MTIARFIAAVSALCLQAQPASPPVRPKFDVVSVKPCKPGDQNNGGSSPGRLHIGCGILAGVDNIGLIQVAYNRYANGNLSAYGLIPIEGAPDWIHSEAFEIDAKSEGSPSLQMMEGPMMQTLLEDRFHLRIHHETRQGAVYELTVGKGPLKLQPMQSGKCIPVVMGRSTSPLASNQRICRNIVGPGSVNFEGGTLSMFASLLRLILDRPVIDKTGIATYFQIQLRFAPDDSAAPSTDPGTDAPGIFQAIQEQLGLKLVPAKGPVDVLVIDHIERPSGN